jgi:hypothetical protein
VTIFALALAVKLIATGISDMMGAALDIMLRNTS